MGSSFPPSLSATCFLSVHNKLSQVKPKVGTFKLHESYWSKYLCNILIFSELMARMPLHLFETTYYMASGKDWISRIVHIMRGGGGTSNLLPHSFAPHLPLVETPTIKIIYMPLDMLVSKDSIFFIPSTVTTSLWYKGKRRTIMFGLLSYLKKIQMEKNYSTVSE